MYKRMIVVVLAIAAAAFGAIAISQAASTPNARHHRRPYKGAAVLYRQFSIFRSASAAAATPLPPGEAEHLTEQGTEVAEYQLEPAQARYLSVDGAHAWVTPGRKGLCLTVLAPDGRTDTSTCGSSSQAASKGDLLVSRESSGPVVYGLVPDGDSVTVTNQDGSHGNVPVTSNFFKYSGSASTQSISVHSAGGTAVETTNLIE